MLFNIFIHPVLCTTEYKHQARLTIFVNCQKESPPLLPIPTPKMVNWAMKGF